MCLSLVLYCNDDHQVSLCTNRLKELSNPGASGSLFFLSNDDNFIIKTVQRKEAIFLQKLLPGYYLNLAQNKKTTLPKFYGSFQYEVSAPITQYEVSAPITQYEVSAPITPVPFSCAKCHD